MPTSPSRGEFWSEVAMGAFEALTATLGENATALLRQYRQDLVSARGNFSSGNLAETMDITLAKSKRRPSRAATKTSPASAPVALTSLPGELDSPPPVRLDPAVPVVTTGPAIEAEVIIEGELLEVMPPASSRDAITQLFITAGRGSADYGFVFTPAGTEQLIGQLARTPVIDLAAAGRDQFFFADADKRAHWEQASLTLQKRLIARNLKQLLRKTDIQYRIHGDRLHYLVIGKVVTSRRRERGDERKVYPLLLFACEHVDEAHLRVEIEGSGFLNFWLDQEIFAGELSRLLAGGLEIALDEHLPATLSTLAAHTAAMTWPEYDQVILEPQFSLLGIVTGFETEYVDSAWEKIL